MRALRFSFRSRLFLGAVLPALLMVSLLEMIFLERYRTDIERSFLDRGRAIARQLGPAAEYALFTGSTETLRVLAEATRESDAGILSVSVLGEDGKALAHAGPTSRQSVPLENVLQVFEGGDRTTVVAPIIQTTLATGEAFDVWESTPTGPGRVAGFVVVELSRAQLERQRQEMLQITVAILLGGLLLAGWLSFRIAAGVLRQLDAAANELRRQKEIAETLARRDPLTDLANRRAFDEAASLEIERAKRYGSALSLIMTDIDHFKTINDSHGHHVGDQVLRNFAEIMTGAVRSVDMVGRWGGEEFVILLPGTGLEEACNVAERMRLTVAGAPFHHGKATFGYTASFGVAEFCQEDPTMDSLLGRADAALYRAKDAGRNRVEAG